METAVFSAASLFHGADDSDDDRGMSIKATPTQPSSHPSPLRRSPRAPNGRCFLVCGVEDEMQVSAEGKKPVALEYEERAHDFPGMVWFHDSAVLVRVCRNWERCFFSGIRKGPGFELLFNIYTSRLLGFQFGFSYY